MSRRVLAAAAVGAFATAVAAAAPSAPARLESGAAACEVTRTPTGELVARLGGRRLSTRLPSGGVIRHSRDADGSISTKLGWVPTGFGDEHTLTVSGKRVGAVSPPMRVLGVNWDYSSTGRGSWATAVSFPTTGCWRITARVAGLRLSYVTRVVAG